MTAVDVDALDAARAAATASYLKLTAEYWRDGDWTTWDWHEHADDLLALLNMRSLLAEVRRGRALREAVRAIVDEMERDERDDIPPHVPLLITALRAAVDAS